ncbi:MAG: SAM-dependent methyltransferase [Verrucomicrobiales bacterium]|nr:SAM-dependent methyltransferase [Verrucomicrobiales bacterium]
MTEAPLDELFSRWKAALDAGTFVRAVVSGPTKTSATSVEKLLVRSVDLRGQCLLAITSRRQRQDEVKNYPPADGLSLLRQSLMSEYRNALVCTTEADWQWTGTATAEGSGQLIRHKPSQSAAPSRSHDHAKRSLLDARAKDWLQALDVVDREGRIKASRADKHRQIHRYLEVLNPLISGIVGKPETPLRIVDMGSGKGYLTFAVWHWFHRIAERPATVVGIEAREELVKSGNEVATQIGASGLEFRCGTIQDCAVETWDILIALHACNRATDEAILKGVAARAQLILLSPCCHQELRPQLQDPAVLAPLMSHGILKERMAEWLTDGLRALYLEAAGYRTQVFEFVEAGHTPKNLMISATRSALEERSGSAVARNQIQELKRFFGLVHHPLDSLLAANTPTPSRGVRC